MNLKFKSSKNLSVLKKTFSFLTIFFFFYIWDFEYLPFNYFYIILLPTILLVFDFEQIKENLKFFILLSVLFTSFLFFNILGYAFEIENIPLNKILKLVGLILLINFCFFYFKEIKNQIKLIVITFSTLYFVTNTIDVILNLDNYSVWNLNIFKNLMCHYRDGFFRTNFIFKENSHFGMIGVSLTFFLFYLSSTTKNKLYKIFYLILCLSFIFNLSTTYLLGSIFSSVAIIISCYKNINKEFYVSIFFVCAFSLYMLFGDSSCAQRLKHMNKTNDIIINLKTQAENLDVESSDIFLKKMERYYSVRDERWKINTLITKTSDSEIKKNLIGELGKLNLEFEKLEIELKKVDKNRFRIVTENLTLNVTTQVYIRSFHIAKEALLSKFYGWGFENYDVVNAKFKFIIPTINPQVLKYNTSDASNNFVKIISELGIFGIIILIYFIKISLNKNIEPQFKYFLMPLIIMQQQI